MTNIILPVLNLKWITERVQCHKSQLLFINVWFFDYYCVDYKSNKLHFVKFTFLSNNAYKA